MPEEFKDKIKKWEDERLSRGYQLYNLRLDEPKYALNREELESRIGLIKDEWGSRSSHDGNYSWPREGLLSVMGYKVGKNGLKEEARRRILKDVISGPLPLVANKGYMAEWGEDGSNGRIKKTRDCLKGFIHGAQNSDRDMSVAIQDWTDDLEWLNENY